ncbi:MAG: methionine--tRNA ligase subunit beta, partial [Deltaproteobacteria bacterium]
PLPAGAHRGLRRRRLGAGAVGAAEAAGAGCDPRGRDGPPDGQALGRGPGGAARAVRGAGAGGDGDAREGGAGMITIDQFRAIDLRVGTVRAAEPHPNADRLLLLRVDLGTEERQLVAGIRAHYDPAALVGSQVVVVANLEPAKLRGVESQGMVLAASDGDRVVLLRPDDPVTPGAVVR